MRQSGWVSSPHMKAERVLTVNHFYDCPRLGVAEWNGVPHIFESEFDYQFDEYSDTFLLSPIEPELLAMVLENWAISCRWNAAFKRGEVTIESHPALPVDRARYEELQRAIGQRLKADPSNHLRCTATFTRTAPDADWDEAVVAWQAV